MQEPVNLLENSFDSLDEGSQAINDPYNCLKSSVIENKDIMKGRKFSTGFKGLNSSRNIRPGTLVIPSNSPQVTTSVFG